MAFEQLWHGVLLACEGDKSLVGPCDPDEADAGATGSNEASLAEKAGLERGRRRLQGPGADEGVGEGTLREVEWRRVVEGRFLKTERRKIK